MACDKDSRGAFFDKFRARDPVTSEVRVPLAACKKLLLEELRMKCVVSPTRDVGLAGVSRNTRTNLRAGLRLD